MKSYCIKLPRNVDIDIFDLPKDFERIVEHTFKDFTEGTNPAYMYCDKLLYIDRLVERNSGIVSDAAAVSNLVKSRFEYEWDENGELLDSDDIYSNEFMEECFKRGRESEKLYQHYGSDDHHIYDQIQKVMVEIIKIVMNYEGVKA